MRVAVLGCGPTGLLVAHAVEQAGHQPIIYSIKQKSVIPGSQHLHGPVPGVTSLYPEGTIQFVRLGTARDYARKVYGDGERETGWDNYLQVYPSWNVIAAYDKLWERFAPKVHPLEITPSVVRNLQEDYSCIITTVPAQSICSSPGHRFNGTEYWIKPLPTPEADKEHEIVVYNGLPHDDWYRWSILGGACSIEFAHYPVMHVSKKSPVIKGWKAIDNDCDCFEGVHRCGRWAEWRHGVTMFKAYEKAVTIMEGL